jgi:ketosteroid isomerase-like protein
VIDMSNPIDPAALPAVITRYLAAHLARDLDAAMACYTDDAVAVDEGHTYRGPREIRDWLLGRAAAGRYTTTLLATYRVDDERYVAVHHLEGDFPGGVVDLRFRFTLRDGRIAELVIEP